jgi:hypothetical protein
MTGDGMPEGAKRDLTKRVKVRADMDDEDECERWRDRDRDVTPTGCPHGVCKHDKPYHPRCADCLMDEVEEYELRDYESEAAPEESEEAPPPVTPPKMPRPWPIRKRNKGGA